MIFRMELIDKWKNSGDDNLRQNSYKNNEKNRTIGIIVAEIKDAYSDYHTEKGDKNPF